MIVSSYPCLNKTILQKNNNEKSTSKQCISKLDVPFSASVDPKSFALEQHMKFLYALSGIREYGTKNLESEEEILKFLEKNFDVREDYFKGFVDKYTAPKNIAMQLFHKSLEWKPLMNKKQSKKWAKNSVLPEIYYHGASIEAAKKISYEGFKFGMDVSPNPRVLDTGFGVYLSTSEKFASNYPSPDFHKNRLLSARVNVKKPAVVVESNWDCFKSILKSDMEELCEQNNLSRRNVPLLMNYAIPYGLEKIGYDSVIVKDHYGGLQLMIFDPKDVVVVG